MRKRKENKKYISTYAKSNTNTVIRNLEFRYQQKSCSFSDISKKHFLILTMRARSWGNYSVISQCPHVLRDTRSPDAFLPPVKLSRGFILWSFILNATSADGGAWIKVIVHQINKNSSFSISNISLNSQKAKRGNE